jgi:nitrogen regulatory protein PII
MKKIEAFIKSHRLDELVLTMQEIEGLQGLTITNVQGFGRGRPDGKRNLQSKTRIEVFCTDEMVKTVVAAIEQAAHTGLRSDGKIYIIPVEDALRISTGEHGDSAV